MTLYDNLVNVRGCGREIVLEFGSFFPEGDQRLPPRVSDVADGTEGGTDDVHTTSDATHTAIALSRMPTPSMYHRLPLPTGAGRTGAWTRGPAIRELRLSS
jgi:hypothetical protein